MAVEAAIKQLPGVSSVEVDLSHQQAQVTYDDNQVSRAKINESIQDAGYQPL